MGPGLLCVAWAIQFWILSLPLAQGRGIVCMCHASILTPPGSVLPFTFRCLQFPVRPAFAMTINKAQSQSLQYMGLYLPHPVFSHGQYYVAVSRVGGYDRIVVLSHGPTNPADPEGMYTKNVVFKAVFRGF